MANLDRLKRLVVVLKRVRSNPKQRRDFDLTEFGRPVQGCGTHLCAVGWGARDRLLKKQGLTLFPIPTPEGHLPLCYNGQYGWTAVENFFEVSKETAEFLFSSEMYVSNRAMTPVIDRIESYIHMRED